MSFVPKPQEIYRHFKGNLYQITAIAEHTETGETLVVYQAMYGDFKTYARPLSMFVSRVDRDRYPDAGQEFRFELQGPEAARQRRETESMEEKISMEEKKSMEGIIPMEEKKSAEELSEGERALDPMVLEFLDADTYEQKLNILAGLYHRITDEMITTMAIASDVEIGDGETQERYEELKSCLITMQRYESQRMH